MLEKEKERSQKQADLWFLSFVFSLFLYHDGTASHHHDRSLFVLTSFPPFFFAVMHLCTSDFNKVHCSHHGDDDDALSV